MTPFKKVTRWRQRHKLTTSKHKPLVFKEDGTWYILIYWGGHEWECSPLDTHPGA